MLIEVNIENFRSIKEKVTMSMLATKDKIFKDNLIDTKVLKNDSLLKSAVLYGANASGKTNVFMAISLLHELVENSHSHQKGDFLPFSPFKLDPSYLIKPTIISITFIKNDVQYDYSVAFNKEKVIEEYLYYYPKNHKKIIFERKNTNDYKFIINKKSQQLISDRTLPNTLYISKATQENYTIVSNAFDWFKENLRFINVAGSIGSIGNLMVEETTIELLKNESNKSLILKALSEADVGIDDISIGVEKLEITDARIDDIPTDIEKLEIKRLEVTNVIKEIFTSFEIKNKRKEKILKSPSEFLELEFSKLITFHKGVEFDLSEESAGTQKLFYLIGPWINILMKGGVFIIDELDVQLHPYLIEFLIKLFHDPTQNKKNAQLIFTTHNTKLLNIQDIFRRDQIYFTEKNYETGATNLYSLVEFRQRTDKNIEKEYLAGRYGAVPFIKEGTIFETE